MVNLVSRVMTTTTIPTKSRPRANPCDLDKVIDIYEWLHLHLHAKLSVAMLARKAGINASKLQRLFQTQYGVAIMTYVRARRLVRARYQLEHTSANIKTVAAAAGYTRISAFTHAFRAFHGFTPGQICRTHVLVMPANPQLNHTLL